MKKRLFIAVILLAIILVGVVGFNMFRDKMIGDFFASRQQPAVTVPTHEVTPQDWTPVIDAIGTVDAVRGVDLTVEAAGIVKEISFEANDEVEEGSLIVRLDDAVQEADLAAARAQAQLDKQASDRARTLQDRGVTSGVTLDEAEGRATASLAQVAKLEAVLDTKRLRAPFSGTIGIPHVDTGTYVTPGMVVATLQDLNTLYVDFNVPEQQFGLLNIGQAIKVGPEEGVLSYDGKVSGIDPKVNPVTRLVSVRAEVELADRVLIPGQFVRVQVQLPTETGVLTVPQTALITSLYGDHVFAVRQSEDDPERLVARQVFVTAGRRSGSQVEIAKGLEPGDRVIVAGQNRLSNGTPVTVDNSVTPDQTDIGPVDAAAPGDAGGEPAEGEAASEPADSAEAPAE